MRRRLPPLNSVRAFEAAARALSFQRAGDELGVTAGAIAQQVKGLEAWLGKPLFRRLPSKGVVLTEEGQLYAASIRDILDALADATSRIVQRSASNVLTVSTVPSLASQWLIPRLGNFRKVRPDLEVRILVSVGLTDFDREDVDIAIRLGGGIYPGMRSDHLMDETFFPVCSPALAADPERPLREPADLRHHTLLHEQHEASIPAYVDWPQWLEAAGVGDKVDSTRGPRFSHTFLAIEAAASGQGVALATSALIGDNVRSGRLVKPFDLELRGPYHYFIVCPPRVADHPNIAAFRDWLLEEASASAHVS